MKLPVADVLEALKSALATGPNAVLVAPPGAGKTTGAAPALLDSPWLEAGHRIVMVLPRRLAVRAAAARIASQIGCSLGGLVGYRVRLETRVSRETRLELVTPGVLLRQIQADPELGGIGAVIFDEVHERGLEMDLALALCLDAQAGLRPDLRLLAMSATIDADRFAQMMGDGVMGDSACPVIVSEGRLFPVETRWLAPRDGERLDRHVARAVAEGLADRPGDVLVFLPGLREIRQAHDVLHGLSGRWPEVDLAVLHGGIDLNEQALALAPAAPGRRKVVLATAIAETSVTLPGVRVVIDSGLARVPRHEPELRLSRLETGDASRATIEQRAGRAGRVAEGLCLRLWHEGTTRARPAHPVPEILNSDLTGFMLELARWGVRDPQALALLDQPPAHSIRIATEWLTMIGALDPDGRLTGHGEALCAFGLAPGLAHMILQAAPLGLGLTAALVAAVLTEAGGSSQSDLRSRVDAIAAGRGRTDAALLAQAGRWAQAAGGQANRIDSSQVGLCLALGMPDRVARRRETAGTWQMANGRSVQVDPVSPLAAHDWLVVADLQGSARAARLMAGAPVSLGELETHLGERFTQKTIVTFDPARGGLEARNERRFAAVLVSSRPQKVQAGPAATSALVEAVRNSGLTVLAWSEKARNRHARLAWLHRIDPAGWPDQGEPTLLSDERTSLQGIDWGAALESRLDWQAQSSLKTLAPTEWIAPSGRACTINYSASDTGPQIEVRPQDLYGLDTHPTILNGRHRLQLALTSPAQRLIALTSDLPGFWRGGWRDARKDMRARYPKHDWPEQPWLAQPVKPRETNRHR
ncbi:MAG: ATP-dependent helicase HrpB [Hyphomonadaceae bacterium]|nr:ATP-dependent helicase HrpB [Hyphomonadaceae bacterium]